MFANILGGIALIASLTGAVGQGVNCDQLRAQIDAAGSGNSAQSARYAAAAQKQQYELERTTAYARSLGCENRQFLFFGSPPPPQCGGIETQIQRMRGNLGQLQAQAQQNNGSDRRRALMARFDASCRGQRGFFDSLFGGERQQVPIEDPDQDQDSGPADDQPLQAQDDGGKTRGGPMAVCVRSCDGGFFPMSYTARRANLGELDDLCKAQCPNAEAHLYTYPSGGDVDQAVSTDGESYSSLPNADKYKTKFDPTCSCKPPNQSWVQALAQAESLLHESKSDVIVTPEKAEELSRAKVPAGKVPTPKATRARILIAPPQAPEDPAIAIDAADSANAPTASNESAGIAPDKTSPAVNYGLKDGVVQTPAAGGTKRRVRIVGPQL